MGTVVLSGDLFFYNYLNTEYNQHSENFAVTVNRDFSEYVKHQRFFFADVAENKFTQHINDKTI